MAVRKIPPNRRSITGHVPSKKKPGMLAFESQLERDLYVLLEFDPTVSAVRDQPVRIPFFDRRGQLQHYTPDCEIEYVRQDGAHRIPLLVEVKYRTDLFALWPDLHPKLRAAGRYARNKGYQFRIITEREIEGARLQNARWLMGYRSLPIPRDEVDEIVASLLARRVPSTPMQLLDELTKSIERREEILVALWFAIANGHVHADLNEKLTMSSMIWAER